MAIFKSRQNTPCGYSKLVPEDVWQDAKGFRSIWSFNPEKTSKMWWKLAILGHFRRFLQTWWMYGPETLCIFFSNVDSHTKTDLKTLIKKRNWQIDFFPWGGIFDLKPLSQCPIQAENFVGMNYMVNWSNSEVRRMFVQGIKSQSKKPENDKNGPKSENFNFFWQKSVCNA